MEEKKRLSILITISVYIEKDLNAESECIPI